MIRKFVICAAACALLGTGIAFAAAPTPVPNAAPDFSSMNFLLGTWHCHETLPNRPGDRQETDTYTMAYDGWVQKDHADSPPFDRFRTRHQVGDSFTTYDANAKLWISESIDNFGGYGVASSSGWSGDTITFTGTNPDGTMGRSTMVKVSDSKYTFKSWGNSKKGAPMMLIVSGTCTKS